MKIKLPQTLGFVCYC